MIVHCQLCGRHVKECGKLFRVYLNSTTNLLLCKDCRLKFRMMRAEKMNAFSTNIVKATYFLKYIYRKP